MITRPNLISHVVDLTRIRAWAGRRRQSYPSSAELYRGAAQQGHTRAQGRACGAARNRPRRRARRNRGGETILLGRARRQRACADTARPAAGAARECHPQSRRCGTLDLPRRARRRCGRGFLAGARRQRIAGRAGASRRSIRRRQGRDGGRYARAWPRGGGGREGDAFAQLQLGLRYAKGDGLPEGKKSSRLSSARRCCGAH